MGRQEHQRLSKLSLDLHPPRHRQRRAAPPHPAPHRARLGQGLVQKKAAAAALRCIPWLLGRQRHLPYCQEIAIFFRPAFLLGSFGNPLAIATVIDDIVVL